MADLVDEHLNDDDLQDLRVTKSIGLLIEKLVEEKVYTTVQNLLEKHIAPVFTKIEFIKNDLNLNIQQLKDQIDKL